MAGSGAAKLGTADRTTNIGTTAESYSGLSFRLQGCDLAAGTTLPNGSGKYICPDAQYSDGNLGKNWNELDLVPHRVLISAGSNPDSTYHFQVEGDNKVFGSPDKIGYDFISAAPEQVLGGCTVSFGSLLTRGTGTNNDPVIMYRDVTVTNQQANTTCQINYYMRLALGAHLWPGSSLHSRLSNNIGTSKNIGNKENSIPVNEISPQELSKDLSASETADNAWDIAKGAEPAHIDFENSCKTGADLTKSVAITITWQKITTLSGITVITHVYATNPAARVITTNVTDKIYSGNSLLDTATSGDVDVPANTKLLVLTHTASVPAGSTNLNDIATATYTDKATGIPVPGQTTATASSGVQVTSNNDTATITDSESISGTGLTFSVDSTSGASGTFGGGYTVGTHTSGSVDWTSATQSGDGSVTFNKTVYLDQPRTTTGSLDDTATVTGSDGFTASAVDSVDIKSAALVDLTINKKIPDVLTGSETQSFTFTVKDKDGNTVATPSISFAAGDTSKSVTVNGLDAGTYTVSEDPATGWNPQSDQQVAITLPSCSGSVTFTNDFPKANAKAVKVTDPEGNESGWEMILDGPGTPAGGEKVPTDGSGNASFSTELQQGSYTITETVQAGWDQTNKTGDCSFTVDYPTDSGKTYTCTFTNVQEGSITVKKVTDPTSATDKFTFTGDLAGSIGNGEQIGPTSVKPGTYSTTETVPSGWDLTKIVCSDADSSGVLATGVTTFKVAAGENVVCTYTDRQRGHAKVIKTLSNGALGTATFTFQLRQGASASQAGAILETGTATGQNGGVINFTTNLVPGQTYQLCEQMQPGWLTTLGPPLYSVFNPSGDNSVVCTDFAVAAGETKTFTIDNQPPPGGMALTIGYWRNWSSCTGGGQKPVLDQTLVKAAASPYNTLYWGANSGGTKLYLYQLNCVQAVNLLNKSTIDTGQKKASDPAFNLAAQLIAAELNLVSGAGTCVASTQAINDASALLAAVHFDGKKHDNLTSAQANTMNSLATTLDKYNNNKLC
jgi:hypothetical protein